MAAPTSAAVTDTKLAPAPFDDQNADIVLRSSDKVDFRVYRLILSLASSFFKDTFNLPQSQVQQPNANLIDLAEDSTVVGKMLQFCYPGVEPQFDDAEELSPVIDALSKYAMDDLLIRAQKILSAFSKQDPVRVFAISYRYRWKDMVMAAAEHTLDLPSPFPGHYVDELDHVPTREYHRLVDYHSQCSSVYESLDDPYTWARADLEWWQKHPCNEHNVSWLGGPRHRVEAPGIGSRTWFKEYLTQLKAEVQRRPSYSNLLAREAMIRTVALEEAFGCPNCREVAHDYFQPWMDMHISLDMESTLYRLTVCEILA